MFTGWIGYKGREIYSNLVVVVGRLVASAALIFDRRNSRQLKRPFLLPKAADAWRSVIEQTEPRRLKSPVLYFTAVLIGRLPFLLY
jgi:hypothetical protein